MILWRLRSILLWLSELWFWIVDGCLRSCCISCKLIFVRQLLRRNWLIVVSYDIGVWVYSHQILWEIIDTLRLELGVVLGSVGVCAHSLNYLHLFSEILLVYQFLWRNSGLGSYQFFRFWGLWGSNLGSENLYTILWWGNIC